MISLTIVLEIPEFTTKPTKWALIKSENFACGPYKQQRICNQALVSNVTADALALKHQVIHIHNPYSMPVCTMYVLQEIITFVVNKVGI